MPHSVIKPQDVGKMELWLQQGVLESITIPPKAEEGVMILMLCNSGPQLRDRLNFYWRMIRVVHPILTHGGITRLSPIGRCFDKNAMAGLGKAASLLPTAVHGAEAHYPCADGELRGYSLEQTLLHAYHGWVEHNRQFGTPEQPVELYFHFDFTGSCIPDRSMETYRVNPVKVTQHIEQSRLAAQA